jgi:methylthioribose-1-phosphate isomerase
VDRVRFVPHRCPVNVTLRGRTRPYRTVRLDVRRNEVLLIEQRLLPHTFRIVRSPDYQATAGAIRDMVVRGAGAIGATAAYGYAQGIRAFTGRSIEAFRRYEQKVFQTLAEARPTAVDPVNAMREVRLAMRDAMTPAECQARALEAAEAFAEEDVRHCRAIGEVGVHLIEEGMRVLTHCNAGWLAFVDIGSATAPLYAAHAAGRKFHVFCDETRPRSQGASLTAWELAQQGISHEILVDGAAGHFMQQGEIDLVIVGADRVLGRTGEVANKIGTYTCAVLAKRHRIPFYVAIPLSTLDWDLREGAEIPIEERSADEVLWTNGVTHSGRRTRVRVANPASSARNPAFDVTPPELITGIITPVGIVRPGALEKLAS